MMYSTTSTSAAAAILALITTTARAAPALAVRSSTSTSTGFRLRVQSTSYGSGAVQYLTYQRLGLGFNFATVGSSSGVFYQNGGDPSTSTVLTDAPGVYPLGLSVSLPGEVDSVGEHGVFVTLNGVTGGLSVNSAGVLAGPVDAEYLVCERDVPVGGTGPQSFEVVKVRYAGEEVPAGCEAVQFVAECAVLEELPWGSAWDHDDVVPVSCSLAQS